MSWLYLDRRVCFARSLPLEVFGEWVLFIAAGSFVEMFRFGITNTGLIRYYLGLIMLLD
jgi:hypothetical protein